MPFTVLPFTLGGPCPPRTPHCGPPAPADKFCPTIHGVKTYQRGPEADGGGVLERQGPPAKQGTLGGRQPPQGILWWAFVYLAPVLGAGGP